MRRDGVGVRLAWAAPALLALLFAVRAHAQFSAQPVIVELVAADSARTAVVTARNEGQQEMQFRFSLADFEQTSDGDHHFFPLGSSARSCAGRVTVFPDGATLRPGERQEVRVRMEPGPRTCWGVLMVENVARGERAGIRVGQQIAVKLYGVPPSTPVQGEVASVSAARAPRGIQVAINFRNTGEAPLRPEGAVEIRTLNGEAVATLPVDAFSVLPGQTRRVTVEVTPLLPRGRYVVVPVLDFGAEYLAGGQASFAVP
jgi:hypothetical protein